MCYWLIALHITTVQQKVELELTWISVCCN